MVERAAPFHPLMAGMGIVRLVMKRYSLKARSIRIQALDHANEIRTNQCYLEIEGLGWEKTQWSHELDEWCLESRLK